MKSILLSISKRVSSCLGVFFILCILSIFSLRAQQSSDFELTTTTTTATCENNGAIEAKVTSKNPIYTIKSVTYTYCNQATGSLIATQNTLTSKVTGLGKGNYSVEVSVLINENGTTISLKKENIQVISTYKNPTISLGVYRPSFKKKNTGMISVRVTNGSASKYAAKLLSVPPGYTGYKEFEFNATEDTKYFYDLPAGEYSVQVSDECNNYPAQKLKIADNGLSDRIDRNVPKPHRNKCGWYDFRAPFRTGNLYFTNIDTLKKYIEVGFDRPAQLTSSSGSVWKSFDGLPTTIDDSHDMAFDPAKIPDNSPLYVKLKNGDTWYKMTRATSEADRYVLAYRVKDTDEIQQYKMEYRDRYPWIASYLAFNGFPCGSETHGRQTWLTERDVAYCPPVTVTVVEKNNPNVEVTAPLTLTIDNVGWQKAVEYKDKNDPSKPYQFQSQKEYIITARDSNGDVQKIEIGKMDPKFKSLVNYKVEDYCVGTKKSNLSFAYRIPVSKVISESGRQYEEYRDIISFKDYTVTLVDAPAGFTPPSGAVCKKNTPYKIPHEYHKKWFFPFGTTGDPDMDEKQYIELPSGEYKFEIEDRCHNKKTETIKVDGSPEKYALGTKILAPKIEVKDCGRVRIYPFGNGIDDLILKNNVSYVDEELYVHITDLPTGVKETDVQVGSGGSSLWLQAKVEESGRYFDLPVTKGVLKISVKIRTKDGVEIYPSCIHNTTEVDLSNANLGYDRDSYVGYKCPSGKTGYVYLMPINYVGNLDIALRSADASAAIMEQKNVTVDPSKGVEFKLSSTSPLADDYLLYIKDLTCLNDNGKGTPITLYDLGSTSIVRTTRIKSKYCEGESIRLEAVSLGGKVEYQWTLPDGSKYPMAGPSRDARVYEIASATNAQHSGVYTLEAKNVICEGAPTSIYVKFKLSVAPTVLWWASDAQNANWYDVENWRNTLGVKVKAIPAACTTVHIPSEVDNYFPDLDPSISKYDEKEGTYGAAECNDVYFHYGSQLGRPQLLRYSRAYVDYNFGKMQMGGTVVAHAEPHFPQSDKQLMARDRWYMLATPLKNILSGDFGLAGYPMTYQRHFKSGIATTSGLSEASFEKPVNSLIENMSSFNHAIALKVAGQSAKVGYNDHKNLNGLNGIIRIPYYLNDAVGAYYPLHKYIPETNTSAFRYYNMETLAPMSKVNRFTRKPEEDFRFVFETGGKKAIGAISVAGTSVEGYAFQLTGDTNSELRMVGNPFMSAIDFDHLKEVNSTLIEPYYYIFTDNTWKVYYSGVTSPSGTLQKEIAPLQAIVIKKKATGALLFPTAGEKNVLLAPNKQLSVKSHSMTEPSDGIRRVSVIPSNSAGHGAESVLLPDTDLAPAPALFYPAIDEVPTVYFVDTETGTPNVIQSGAYRSVVPMGVHSSVVGTVHLDFSSLTQGLFTRVVLYDRETCREQDLLANPYYLYQNRANEGTRFELRMEYPGVKSVDTPLADGDLLRVSPTEAGYRVESAVALKGFSLWAVDGKLLGKSFGIDALEFFVDRAYCQSVVILKVHLADGSTLTRKLPKL